MTIKEAITAVDHLKPNQYTEAFKVGWLSKLDGMIFNEIYARYQDAEITEFTDYPEEPDPLDEAATAEYQALLDTTELLVPAPYDEDLYINFLQSQIDRENGEIGKYNQSIILYNNAYVRFHDYYNRTHRRKYLHRSFVY